MVNCTDTLNFLAAQWAGLGPFIGLATGNPGASNVPENEASGGSPAYARVSTTYSAGTTGTQGGTSVTLNLPEGTYTFALACSEGSGSNMFDNAAITSLVMSTQGQAVVQPSFTQQ
jgi:hypothetical protein